MSKAKCSRSTPVDLQWSSGCLASDETLALERQWRAGQVVAVATVLEMLREKFTRMLFARHHHVLSFDEAEELVGVAVARAWKCRASFAPVRGSLEAWLWENAKQAAAEEIRKPWLRERRREHSEPPEKLVVFVQPPREAPMTDDSSGALSSRSRLVTLAMEALSEGERKVLWTEACSPNGRIPSGTLGKLLGISKSTVRSHRARGIRKLELALLELGYRPTRFAGGGAPSDIPE